MICMIVTVILFYRPFFGDKKDFFKSLDAFLTSNDRLGWFNDYRRRPRDSGKAIKMVIFLVVVFVISMFARVLIGPLVR